MYFKQYLMCVHLFRVVFVVFTGEIGENPQGKSISGVWLTCACVFATKTMAVRIFLGLDENYFV
jgi:hypothetical protein